MALKQSGELKKRAWLAKQRLKMGYWNASGLEEQTKIKEEQNRRTVTLSNSKVDLLDDKLYAKVCEMLDKDEAVINPIGQLIDNDVYGRLDALSRQRYILELSNKFRELKERYYRERTGA